VTKHILNMESISVKYGIRNKKEAVKGLSLVVDEGGKCIALVGANGAGKTTTIRAILGLQKISAGAIKREGKFAYLPENASIYPYLTCRENVEFYLQFSGGKGNVTEYLSLTGISQLEKVMGYKLSKGQKRRLNLAMVLSSDANFICLDEPFEGLDPISSFELASLIKKLKRTGIVFLISSHVLTLVQEIADDIIFMRSGNAVEDPRTHQLNMMIIEISSPTSEAIEACGKIGYSCRIENGAVLYVDSGDEPQEVVRKLINQGVEVKYARRPSLEEAFRREYGS